MAELVAGIGHCNRVSALGNALSREDLGSLRAGQPIRIETEMDRQRPVQLDQSGRRNRRRYDAGEKVRRECRIGMFEWKMDRHGLKMGISGK